MAREAFERAAEFFRRCLGHDWEEEATPVELSGAAVTEALWPLNEVFRPRLVDVENLEYDPRYAAAADSALDDMAEAMDIAILGQAPAGVVCVLLERHKQMLVVAMANEAAGNPVTYLPSGLSPEQKCIALALLFLRGMTFPWPPGGPYADEPH